MFDLTPGELLFYSGIVGIILIAVITIVITILHAGSRKRLRRRMNDEYGEYRNNVARD